MGCKYSIYIFKNGQIAMVLKIFQDVDNRERITYSNFRDGHGEGSTNCVFMLTRSGGNSGKWGSAQCSDQSPR